MDTFYAGWVLTGRASGQVSQYSFGLTTPPLGSAVSRPDRRTTSASPATCATCTPKARSAPTWCPDNGELDYSSGFDLRSAARSGTCARTAHFAGSAEVENAPDNGEALQDVVQNEVEFKQVTPSFDGFELSGTTFFNDSFDSPEYRGSNRGLGQADVIQVLGTLQHVATLADWVDYYGVGLLAGRPCRCSCSPPASAASTGNPARRVGGASLLNVGVFDPDGRLIATDYSNVGSIQGEVIQFTATAPAPTASPSPRRATPPSPTPPGSS
jgi:hypothetical protein